MSDGNDDPAGDLDARSRSQAEARDRERVESRGKELLVILTHELRGPLNAILGWTQLFEPRTDLPDDVAHGLRVIHRNATRQKQLLDDLLEAARGTSGGFSLDRRPVAMQEAVEEACEAVRPDVARKGLTLDCAPAAAATVLGDSRRLQQVLRNLLANAVRFTPPGGSIKVRTFLRGDHVAVSIEDTGAGMDPAFLPVAFEPFRQQAGASGGDRHNLGLGLALVRSIIEAHGGRVSAESEGPGKGARFTVLLPAWQDVETLPASPSARPGGDGAPLAGIRVLAVDDDADWQELVKTILTAVGADVRVAGSAADGLAILRAWEADVVLSDIAMPGMDGYDFLTAIHELPGARARMPLVAMTAHASAHDRSRAMRAGFDHYLSKPIAARELIDTVQRAARGSTRTARAALAMKERGS